MTAYALHPEPFGDIDEIRAYIADRMVTEIFDAVRALVPFPLRILPPPPSHLASPSV